jgi:hypothetical protein
MIQMNIRRPNEIDFFWTHFLDIEPRAFSKLLVDEILLEWKQRPIMNECVHSLLPQQNRVVQVQKQDIEARYNIAISHQCRKKRQLHFTDSIAAIDIA